jgi:hypothetical protein
MTQKIGSLFLIFFLLASTFAIEQKNVLKEDEKTVAKRGIFHLNVHGHHHHIPATPHHFVPPHVHHFGHHQFVPKYHILQKPIHSGVPLHIHHGGATVTSFNANFPRYPLLPKAVVPSIIPPHHHHLVPNLHSFLPHHHHHHAVLPHFHIARPIVPIAIPFPKYPVVLPQKPIFIHSKPQFVTPPPTPTFVPIPVPTENSPASFNPLLFNSGSDKLNNQQNSTTQQHAHEKLSASCLPLPHNYHAHNLVNHIDRKLTNHFQVSGHGQHYQLNQQLIQEPQQSMNNFLPYQIF